MRTLPPALFPPPHVSQTPGQDGFPIYGQLGVDGVEMKVTMTV